MQIERTGNTEESFLSWAAPVNRSEFWYFAATSLEDQLVDIPNLLAVFACDASDLTNDTWQEDDDVVQKAAQDWIKQKVIGKHANREDAISRVSLCSLR